MNFSSIKFLTGEGVKSAWVNRFMTLASIGVLIACMVLIGLATALSLNVDKTIGNLEQQNVVMAFFDDYNAAMYSEEEKTPLEDETVDENGIADSFYVIHNDEEAEALCEEIRKIDNVASVEYITSDAGLENVKGTMLEGEAQYFTFLDEEYGNPLSAAAKVTMTNLEYFDDTVAKIKALNGVDTIQSQRELANTVNSIKNGISVAGTWIIAILIIIALVIVSNTIRVTMYNRKLEICIMKAVGATDRFIRFPFIVEGVLIGLISAVASEGLLYVVYRIATEAMLSNIMTVDLIKFSEFALPVFGIFVAIGIVAGTLGSVLMIGKYLKREGSEFSAI